ncbi:hypothetical protein NP493_444g01033 [Ridgeia piscesae]|uniref:Glycosyltransferase 2-like domain-containing protein n=1 Tax=Ridgeia piscesae TaxID=27915 RepID=A0AAD9L0Z0_RIDPI|nr:hypothetical protein NP493_444g01033 [Ridgeia piscesae]
MSSRLLRYHEYQKTQRNRTGQGENGGKVVLTRKQRLRARDLFAQEGINIVASDIIALDRALPDFRSDQCRTKVYPKDLPTASVIIIYYNEAWSPILRTVHSVINRSPPMYLEEVILVDDSSTRPELAEPLHSYVRVTWPDGIVKLVHTPKRLGLIGARLAGAEAATGEVLVFLDAHCETTDGWLEPLLSRMRESRTAVVCPTVDAITDDKLRYVPSPAVFVGGFSWSLHFKWHQLSAYAAGMTSTVLLASSSPVMPGGLFAVDRRYFFEIGGYDPGMEIWGGENLELSFRVRYSSNLHYYAASLSA